MLAVTHTVEKTDDFLRAQNYGEFLWLLRCRDDLVEVPRPFQRDLIEKPQGGDGDEDRAGRQLALVGEIDLVSADLLGPQFLR